MAQQQRHQQPQTTPAKETPEEHVGRSRRGQGFRQRVQKALGQGQALAMAPLLHTAVAAGIHRLG